MQSVWPNTRASRTRGNPFVTLLLAIALIFVGMTNAAHAASHGSGTAVTQEIAGNSEAHADHGNCDHDRSTDKDMPDHRCGATGCSLSTVPPTGAGLLKHPSDGQVIWPYEHAALKSAQLDPHLKPPRLLS
jgi:hypothetical protein